MHGYMVCRFSSLRLGNVSRFAHICYKGARATLCSRGYGYAWYPSDLPISVTRGAGLGAGTGSGRRRMQYVHVEARANR